MNRSHLTNESKSLSDKTTKLTDFPYSSPGYGRKVAVVAVGSAGCKIASQLSRESRLLEHFLYVTSDEHDIASVTDGERILIEPKMGKVSPYQVRGAALKELPRIRKQLNDSEIVLVIAGLGGCDGSGLAPLIANESRAKGALTLAIVVMPYIFEKSKHFYAGSALKIIKGIASGVVVIDNDELLQQNMSVIDAYALVNQRIALALNKLLGSAQEHEFSIGLSNLLSFVNTNSYSVLCLGDSQLSEHREAVLEAASHFSRTVDPTEASSSLVHLCSEKSITMTELSTSVGRLSGILGSGSMQIEFGFSANSSTVTTAIIMATGFTSTKFDCYDPVDDALGRNSGNLESSFDSQIVCEDLLYDLES